LSWIKLRTLELLNYILIGFGAVEDDEDV